MQELVGKLGGGDLVGKNFGGGDLVGKNLNNIVGNLWKQQEEGSGSSHGNMVSSNVEIITNINILTAKVSNIQFWEMVALVGFLDHLTHIKLHLHSPTIHPPSK